MMSIYSVYGMVYTVYTYLLYNYTVICRVSISLYFLWIPYLWGLYCLGYCPCCLYVYIYMQAVYGGLYLL